MAVSPTLADTQCAAGRADALALRWLGWNGERIDFSYGQLADAASRCATSLLDAGLTAGETVGVMVGRRPETVIAALGIWKAGGVYCPLYADLGPDPLMARLELGRVRMLVVDADLYADVIIPLRSSLPELRVVFLVQGEWTAPG